MKKSGGAGIGSVTLIMLFSVLCLTVFSVLSLSSARAELNLTNRYVGSVEGYYEADAFATRIFARLLKAGDLAAEAGVIKQELDFDVEVLDNNDGSYEVNYTREIDETLSLIVSLRFTQTDVNVQKWVIGIVSWELFDSADWNVDEKIEVWDGT